MYPISGQTQITLYIIYIVGYYIYNSIPCFPLMRMGCISILSHDIIEKVGYPEGIPIIYSHYIIPN